MVAFSKRLVAGAVLLLAQVTVGFQILPVKESLARIWEGKREKFGQCHDFITSTAVTIAAASILAVSQPAVASASTLSPQLETAIVETSDATYPLLQSLSNSDVDLISPFANKLAGLLSSKIPAEKASNALDKGIDAFLGIPMEDIETFTGIVKSSYSGTSLDSCKQVAIPTAAISQIKSSNFVQQIEASKLIAVDELIASALVSIPKSDTSICVPATKEALKDLWIGQTQLSQALPRRAAREFVAAASTAAKSVPPSELLRVLPEAKSLSKGLDVKSVKKLEMAGTNLDKELKKDATFARFLPQK
mmetsp:Transcript_10246/g.14706  ORF Transcript_10246/g.14706 Transcript_10246/m.14706 type:complete len:306 (-) Transcript_10246:44-961(-)|eukprot:CAMPEP_0202451262 /NCGR_PEP_ID=MMETSP1360-20130828/9725_1 /ASSEMBLY_ACC=CAM_ASM_000848 /TAXON_ID=515479 /ORGANISM="Licmophora paradoxa, Strain CCMP2313" /LENGTH=305 /DNA_ID=CAMNT_0049069783 /DNA_START=47 /DNA_END=964 /DNA_ORIENTATION=+